MSPSERDLWDREWREFVAAGEDMRVQELIDEMKLVHLRAIFGATGGGAALEVGCGTGHLSWRLAALGYRTTCMDFSRTALGLARQRYRRSGRPGAFVLGDAFALPFTADRFDLVTSTGLLEHFREPDAIVREMVRVLRPGGLFYSDIWPHKFSLFRAFDGLRRLKHRATGHAELYESRFHEGAIRALLERLGLDRIRVIPAGVLPPILPVVFRSRRAVSLYAGLLRRWSGALGALDGSRAARMLGCYYSVGAVKNAAGLPEPGPA